MKARSKLISKIKKDEKALLTLTEVQDKLMVSIPTQYVIS
jgi:hypothetical protein